MVRMVEMMQERQTGFVPIIAPHTQEPANRMLVPQLSTLIGAEKEELPMFFVLNPLTDQVVPFPSPIDDINTVSPELVLLWGRRTILYLEIEKIQNDISKLKDRKKRREDGDYTEEWGEAD